MQMFISYNEYEKDCSLRIRIGIFGKEWILHYFIVLLGYKESQFAWKNIFWMPYKTFIELIKNVTCIRY